MASILNGKVQKSLALAAQAISVESPAVPARVAIAQQFCLNLAGEATKFEGLIAGAFGDDDNTTQATVTTHVNSIVTVFQALGIT